MSNLSQFFNSVPACTSIVNSTSAGGTSTNVSGVNSTEFTGKVYLSGALTAGVLSTALTVTGAGWLTICALVGVDATSRTLRLKVTIDGVVVYDATSSAINNALYGLIAAGHIQSDSVNAITGLIVPQSGIRFNKSLLIEIASSLTETSKQKTLLAYLLTS